MIEAGADSASFRRWLGVGLPALVQDALDPFERYVGAELQCLDDALAGAFGVPLPPHRAEARACRVHGRCREEITSGLQPATGFADSSIVLCTYGSRRRTHKMGFGHFGHSRALGDVRRRSKALLGRVPFDESNLRPTDFSLPQARAPTSALHLSPSHASSQRSLTALS